MAILYLESLSERKKWSGRLVATAWPTASTLASRRLELLLHLLSLRLNIRAQIWLTENFAPIDPYFHADRTVNGVGCRLGEIDVGPDSVQGNASFKILFCAAHFCTAKTPCNTNTDTLRPHAHGRRNRLLHGSTERNAALQLLSHVLSDQFGIKFRTLDFVDVYPNVLFVRQFLNLLPELLHLAATAANDDAGATCM